ncbi:MAG: hypothetical protein K0V04_02700 [Deltaproteobacteria bacterium]|nr:hypothetical protein [Deltaproteobacteria bacterium]
MSDQRDAAVRAVAVRFVAARCGSGGDDLRVRIASDEVDQTDPTLRRVRVVQERPMSAYLARYNARTGEPLGWFFDRLMVGSERGGVPPSECLLEAIEVAQPPEGAVLEHHGYEDLGGSAVFVARWRHEHEGVVVEHDGIEVRVNGRTGKAFALHRRWHEIDEASTDR